MQYGKGRDSVKSVELTATFSEADTLEKSFGDNPLVQGSVSAPSEDKPIMDAARVMTMSELFKAASRPLKRRYFPNTEPNSDLEHGPKTLVNTICIEAKEGAENITSQVDKKNHLIEQFGREKA